MDKKTIFYASLVIALLLLVGYWALAMSTTDFTNSQPLNGSATNSSNNSLLFKIKYVNATHPTSSCFVVYDGTIVHINTTMKTAVNDSFYSNLTFGSDGRHTWYVNCTNSTQVQFPTQELIVDTTNPTYADIVEPQAEKNLSSASVVFNITGIDAIGDYYQSGRMVNFSIFLDGVKNKSVSGFGNGSQVTFTENIVDGYHQWNFTIRDNASNAKWSGTQNFRVDTTAPTLAGYTTTMVNGSATTSGNRIARMNFTSIDAQLPIHTAYAYVYVNSTKTLVLGTLLQNETGTNIMNQLDIYPSSIPYDGKVIIEPGANDTLGNTVKGTNQTNFTKVSLYTGWNLIQVQRNNTLEGIKNMSSEITLVSKYNGTYNTYTTGAASHAGSTVVDGDAVFVYSKSNIGLLQRWGAQQAGDVRNMSVSSGWNLMSAYNSSVQLYKLCLEPFSNTSSINVIKAVSFYENGVYYSQVCSITTGWNNNVTVTRGKGYWLNVNESVWMIRNRLTEGA